MPGKCFILAWGAVCRPSAKIRRHFCVRPGESAGSGGRRLAMTAAQAGIADTGEVARQFHGGRPVNLLDLLTGPTKPPRHKVSEILPKKLIY